MNVTKKTKLNKNLIILHLRTLTDCLPYKYGRFSRLETNNLADLMDLLFSNYYIVTSSFFLYLELWNCPLNLRIPPLP